MHSIASFGRIGKNGQNLMFFFYNTHIINWIEIKFPAYIIITTTIFVSLFYNVEHLSIMDMFKYIFSIT